MSGSKHSVWGCVWGQDQAGWDTLGLVQESSSTRGRWREGRADLFSQSQLPKGWEMSRNPPQLPPRTRVGAAGGADTPLEAPVPQG